MTPNKPIPVMTETGSKVHYRNQNHRELTVCGRWVDEERTRWAAFGPRWKPAPLSDPIGHPCLHCSEAEQLLVTPAHLIPDQVGEPG